MSSEKATNIVGHTQSRRMRSATQGRWSAQRRKLSNYLFVLPMLIFMIATMAYPVYVNLDMSLQDLNVRTFRAGDAPFIGLDNYTKLIEDPGFWHSTRLSISFTTISLTFQFLIGFGLALFFNRPFPGNGLMRSLLLLAWLMPAVVGGTLFRWIADGDYGVFNHFLESIGLSSATRYWLINPDFALFGTIVANVWVGAPFHMLLTLAGLQNISPTLYEAASIDGASTFQRFTGITLPLMRSVILGVLLLGFIYTFKVFELIFVMTDGGPVDATTVLPIYIYKLTFSFFRFGEGAAAAMLLLAGLLLLAVGYARIIRAEEVA